MMKNILLPRIFQPFECLEIVRLGKDNDGGYLVNKLDVIKSKKLISFGIGSDTSFEEDFLKLKSVEVETFDKSVDIDRFTHYKENVNRRSIHKILDEIPENTFLKCDIDGAEYEIFSELINYSKKLSGIAIELHGIANRDNFNEIINFISKIDLKLVHAHLNNYSYYITEDRIYVPDVIELSFTSSTNVIYNENLELPHKFDMQNNSNDDEFKIFF